MVEINKKVIRLEIDGKFIGEIQDTGDVLKNIEAFEQYKKIHGIYEANKPAQAINLQAFTFGKIAVNLFDNHLCAPITNGQEAIQFSNNAIPFIVNGAFAIELYLKTLHMIHSKRKEGHELLELFNGLPEAVQISIKQAANEFMFKHNFPPDTDLRSCLSRINKAFVEWRYLHEGNKENKPRQFPISEIIFLLETLSRICDVDLGQVA